MAEVVSAACADMELVLEAAWPLLCVMTPLAGTDPTGTTVGAASTLFNLQGSKHQLSAHAKAAQTQYYCLEALHGFATATSCDPIST